MAQVGDATATLTTRLDREHSLIGLASKLKLSGLDHTMMVTRIQLDRMITFGLSGRLAANLQPFHFASASAYVEI